MGTKEWKMLKVELHLKTLGHGLLNSSYVLLSSLVEFQKPARLYLVVSLVTWLHSQ